MGEKSVSIHPGEKRGRGSRVFSEKEREKNEGGKKKLRPAFSACLGRPSRRRPRRHM